MSDQSAASDAGLACPFVAFDDDRDSRSTRPDHRHRCYAETRPAPRAIAHQEAYCLAAGFARCPTFIDWARRESARAMPPAGTVRSGIAGGSLPDASAYALADGSAPDAAGPTAASSALVDEAADRSRSRPQDWAAPPPWKVESPPSDAGRSDLADAGRSDSPDASRAAAADLAASAAVAAAASAEPAAPAAPESGAAPNADAEVPPFLSPRTAPPASAAPPRAPSSVDLDDELEAGGRGPSGLEDDDTQMRRFGPGTGRSRHAAAAASTQSATRRRPPADPEAPPWERPRRFEAYPAIKTRRGMPNLSPIIIGIAAVAIGALVLFFVPPLLLGLGGGGSSATPTPSVAPSASVAEASITPQPSPTPFTYIVQKNDTISKIAKKFGVSQADLIAANKATLPNPDRIKEGQELIIPVAPPPSGSAPASSSPSASP